MNPTHFVYYVNGKRMVGTVSSAGAPATFRRTDPPPKKKKRHLRLVKDDQ